MLRAILLLKYLWYSLAYFCICHFDKTMSRLKIANTNETIDKIIEDKCSIGRFGDGEFYIILNKPDASRFQRNDAALAKRLQEVLIKPLDHFLVCIPLSWKSTSGLKMYAKLFWKSFVAENRHFLSASLSTNRQYYNAQITRFYIDYRHPLVGKETSSRLKRIWEKQDILIIEGEHSKLGIGNDLFDDCNSVKRIICPSKNAFASYGKILSSAEKYGEDKLILIALGMTATVLAYDLCANGLWALDVGHVDIEYMWMRMGTKKKCPIPGKYVNEVGNGEQPLNDKGSDGLYKSQIICRIS